MQRAPRSEQRSLSAARALRSAALAGALAAALVLAFIPTATAKRDREASPSITSAGSAPISQSAPRAQGTVPAASPPASGDGASSTATQPAASAPRAQGRRAHGERVDSPSGGGQAAGAATSPEASSGAAGESAAAHGGDGHARDPLAGAERAPAPPQRRARVRHRHAAGGEAYGEASAEDGEDGEQAGAGATFGAAQAQAQGARGSDVTPASTSAKKNHKESGGEGKRPHESGKRGKGKSEKGEKGEGEESEAPSAGGSAGSTGTSATSGSSGASTQPALSATPPVEALAPLASAAATTPASEPTPTPQAALAPASGLSTAARTRRRRPHGAAGAARRAARAVHAPQRGVAGAPLTTPAADAIAPAAPRARTASVDARATRHRAHAHTAPLVRTITRIVDVVPTAVRMLIAALLALALALALRSSLSALRARRLERQRGELLEDVGLLQAALLPVTPTRLGPVGTSAAYQPAAGPAAGGDFYDVFALADGRIAVIVGDVSGHGRTALPHTALVRFTLRAYLEAGMSPREALQTAGTVLERQLAGAFATVAVSTYDPRERVLTYATAGHPPPAIVGSQPGARSLSLVTICAAPPIGAGMRTGTRQTVVSLPGRAQVCFYTDGVTEARVGSDLFGSERLVDALTDLGEQATAGALLDVVCERADARPDDMAACVLSVQGEDDEPRVLLEELELDREQARSERAARFLRACGVPRDELAQAIVSASSAASGAPTVLLEVRPGTGAPEVALRRERLAYLDARRAEAAVAR